MTDRDEIFGEEGAVVVTPQPPAAEEYICDEPGCDRTFPTLQGVNMHKIRTHRRNWSGSPKRGRNMPTGSSQCSLCGKVITDARMGAHLRRVHNATVPKRVAQTRTMTYVPSSTTRGAPITAGPNIPVERLPEYRRPDEERYPAETDPMDTVRRATTEFVRLTAERADYKLNLSEFTVDDEVVILRDTSGGVWMLRRIG